jgi:hypothetical protein
MLLRVLVLLAFSLPAWGNDLGAHLAGNANLDFYNTGYYDWVPSSANTFCGRPQVLMTNEDATLVLDIVGPKIVSFSYKSTQGNPYFYVSGRVLSGLDMNLTYSYGYMNATIRVPSGPQTIKWRFMPFTGGSIQLGCFSMADVLPTESCTPSLTPTHSPTATPGMQVGAGSVVVSAFMLAYAEKPLNSKSFVELHNLSDTDTPLAGWSLQFMANDRTWQQLGFPEGSLVPAHGFYLVTYGDALLDAQNDIAGDLDYPSANLAGSFSIALVRHEVLFEPGCSLLGGLEDLVGMDSTDYPVACFEGAAPVPNLIGGYMAFPFCRLQAGCKDTGQNWADFEQMGRPPHNSASAGVNCLNVPSSTITQTSTMTGTSTRTITPTKTITPTSTMTPRPGAVIISQIGRYQGASGFGVSTYNIELHNTGNSPVDITGWRLVYQELPEEDHYNLYANLTGTIPAGGFYLVSYLKGTLTSTLNPDMIVQENKNLRWVGEPGYVVLQGSSQLDYLCNNLDAVYVETSLPAACNLPWNYYGIKDPVIDPVNNYWLLATRKGVGCQNTGLAYQDFSYDLPGAVLRNSVSTPAVCSGFSPTITPTRTLTGFPTVSISPTVTISSTETGTVVYSPTITPEVFSPTLTSTVSPVWPKGLQISQVYANGGEGGAAYSKDFIEIHNLESAPIGLEDYALNFASEGSALHNLSSAIVPAGGFFLVQLDGPGGGNGTALAPDLVISTADLQFEDTVSLRYAADLPVQYDCDVAFGTGAPLPGLTVSTALVRRDGGCNYSDASGSNCAERLPLEFDALAPNPRNSVSAPQLCFYSPTPTLTVSESHTASFTATASRTITITFTATPTRLERTATSTISPTLSRTISETRTPYPTKTFTISLTLTESPTESNTCSATPSATDSGTPTSSATPSVTESFTRTSTLSPTPTQTQTYSASPTPSATFTQTLTHSATPTPSATPSETQSATGTWTPSSTGTSSFTATETPSATRTASITLTLSPSPSNSETPTASLSPTQSLTPTASPEATTTTTASATPLPPFVMPELGGPLVGPVPLAIGQRLCAYLPRSPNHLSWRLYGMDGSVIAQAIQVADEAPCISTLGFSPGVYLLDLEVYYPDGRHERRKQKVVLIP